MKKKMYSIVDSNCFFIKNKNLGDGPPIDRIKRIERNQRISVLTYTIIAIISGIGIFLAMSFFVFNIVLRAHR